MKVLTQADIPYTIAQSINHCIAKIGQVGVIKDINQLAKALNEYQPDMLLLKIENITSIVQAYCDKNNVKIIGFGDVKNADVVADIVFNNDGYYSNLEALSFKQNVPKYDISVFCNDAQYISMTQFLCQNYNVKAYGSIKINHPRYLGDITNIDKYDIINKSKTTITFNIEDAYSSFLLDTYSIMHNTIKNTDFKTFENIVSLMEHVESTTNKTDIEKQKEKIKSDNAFTFTMDILRRLEFQKEASKLATILEEIF